MLAEEGGGYRYSIITQHDPGTSRAEEPRPAALLLPLAWNESDLVREESFHSVSSVAVAKSVPDRSAPLMLPY